MTTESSKKRRSIPLLYGLINAVVAILFLVIMYTAGAKAFIGPAKYIGVLALPITICFLGVWQQRKLQGGYLSLSEGMKASFQIMVIRSFIQTVGEYILFNYIDIPFRQAVAQATADETERMMSKWKFPEEQIEQAVQAILDDKNYTLGNLFFSFSLACIGWFIISLIIAAIMRKKQPPFANTFNQ